MVTILERNNVNVIGNGDQYMLLAHGFGCDQNTWRFMTDALKNDYKLLLFDYVGAGNSDLSAYDEERYSSLHGYAQDVLEICEVLDIRQSVFVGHSVSSMIGMLAAIAKPEYFERLIFVGPSPCYLNDSNYKGGFDRSDLEELFDTMDSNYLGWSNAMAPAIMGNADRPELGEDLANSFCATDPEIAKQFARVTFLSDNRQDLKRLKVPGLILQCSEDIIAPVEVGNYLKEQLTDSKLVHLNATGHCPHLSAPEETIRAIKAYLYP